MLLPAIWLVACAAPREQQSHNQTALPAPEPFLLAQSRVKTTDGEIYLGNLRSRINVLKGRYASSRNSVIAIALASSLLELAEITAEPGVYAEILSLLQPFLEQENQHAQSVAFKALLATHQFDRAQRLLSRSDYDLNGAESFTLSMALGDYAKAEQLVQEDKERSMGAFAREGVWAVELGQPVKALMLFNEALSSYRDTSPLPAAWLLTQQGIVYLRHGETAKAREFFRAAVARLPGYYLALEHLGETELELGNLDAAIAIYNKVVEMTQDPVFRSQLAKAHSANGNQVEAKRQLALAKSELERAVKQADAANLHHGGAFFLEQGELDLAYQAAKGDLELRKALPARILMAKVYRDQRKFDPMCRELALIDMTGLKPPERQEFAEISAIRCQ